ncbi:cell division cycle 20 protein fzy isoform X2 [Oratosquilla oratoria]|uniref:cell division cycle 20 protein fzy isoform X2 n=1 Tax=Oratosquilla oratoria TaxID=337810 RepID=UPI003F76E87A
MNFKFNAQLSEALRMDGDIPGVARWQRKGREQGMKSLSINDENSFANKSGLCVTPSSPRSAKLSDDKSPGRGKSPGRTKSPCRMPKLAVRAPGQKTPRKTPTTPHNCSDRFIPNRSTTDLERSHHLLTSNESTFDNGDEEISFQQKEYKEKMSENLNDGQPPESRVLSFKSKAPQAKEGHLNNLKVMYSAGKPTVAKASCTRHIPSVPEKVLDAPELMDDYYLHQLDWSANNHLGVALTNMVYIWNGGNGQITPLSQYEETEYVGCLSWVKEGNVLAIGLSTGATQLWDVSQQKLIRTMEGHDGRVVSLSWNNYILSSGSRSGNIFHHDVRVAQHLTATLASHSQEVCGLKWSPDGRHLASGGNDNILNIWENGSATPTHTLTQHQAAVKALAWCPWQNNLLATGGGTADRTLRLWNCSTGSCLKEVSTNSQVSSIVWSSHYKELASGHGFSNNQITIWKYPVMAKVADLTGHSGRVLEMCSSPDGQTLVSAAADETIRLWKCWAVDKEKKKNTNNQGKSHPVSMLARTIR